VGFIRRVNLFYGAVWHRIVGLGYTECHKLGGGEGVAVAAVAAAPEQEYGTYINIVHLTLTMDPGWLSRYRDYATGWAV
jgi:hypothetical protein